MPSMWKFWNHGPWASTASRDSGVKERVEGTGSRGASDVPGYVASGEPRTFRQRALSRCCRFERSLGFADRDSGRPSRLA